MGEKTQVSENGSSSRRRRPNKVWRFARVAIVLVIIIIAAFYFVGRLYHGPRDMEEVAEAIPGAPTFPLSAISPGNENAQRALAIPLWLMRRQGAQRAEAVQLEAPADAFFIADWYRQTASQQGWSYIGKQTLGTNTRLICIRNHDGLQVLIGQTRDLFTPFQLIYLQGMSDKQLQELVDSVRAGKG